MRRSNALEGRDFRGSQRLQYVRGVIAGHCRGLGDHVGRHDGVRFLRVPMACGINRVDSSFGQPHGIAVCNVRLCRALRLGCSFCATRLMIYRFARWPWVRKSSGFRSGFVCPHGWNGVANVRAIAGNDHREEAWRTGTRAGSKQQASDRMSSPAGAERDRSRGALRLLARTAIGTDRRNSGVAQKVPGLGGGIVRPGPARNSEGRG